MPKLKTRLPATSRYVATALYVKSGRAFFGVWNAPVITMDGDEKSILLTEENLSLDLIAHKEYSDRSFWWALAFVNKITDVTALRPGKYILIPKYQNINAALLEGRDAQSS